MVKLILFKKYFKNTVKDLKFSCTDYIEFVDLMKEIYNKNIINLSDRHTKVLFHFMPKYIFKDGKHLSFSIYFCDEYIGRVVFENDQAEFDAFCIQVN